MFPLEVTNLSLHQHNHWRCLDDNAMYSLVNVFPQTSIRWPNSVIVCVLRKLPPLLWIHSQRGVICLVPIVHCFTETCNIIELIIFGTSGAWWSKNQIFTTSDEHNIYLCRMGLIKVINLRLAESKKNHTIATLTLWTI